MIQEAGIPDILTNASLAKELETFCKFILSENVKLELGSYYERCIATAVIRLRNQEDLRVVAGEIFSCDECREPFLHKKKMADLGAALYGEGDPRVKALRPKPKFKLGDFVVQDLTLLGADKNAPKLLAVILSNDVDYMGLQEIHEIPGDNLRGALKGHKWNIISMRHATHEEIRKARGE
jgi:hypothetical protein